MDNLIDTAAAQAGGTGTPGASGAGAIGQGVAHRIDAGYGAGFGADAAGFAGALERAAEARAPSPVAKAVMEPLDFIDREAVELVEYAESAMASGNELTPSEIVMLTARSQELMFHAQLTSNVANRTAEGLQQIFRQQS